MERDKIVALLEKADQVTASPKESQLDGWSEFITMLESMEFPPTDVLTPEESSFVVRILGVSDIIALREAILAVPQLIPDKAMLTAILKYVVQTNDVVADKFVVRYISDRYDTHFRSHTKVMNKAIDRKPEF